MMCLDTDYIKNITEYEFSNSDLNEKQKEKYRN